MLKLYRGTLGTERRDVKSGLWGWRSAKSPTLVVESDEPFWMLRQPGKGKGPGRVQSDRRLISEAEQEESLKFSSRNSGAVERVYDDGFESTAAMQQYLGL